METVWVGRARAAPNISKYMRKTNFKTKTVKKNSCKISVFIPNMAHAGFAECALPQNEAEMAVDPGAGPCEVPKDLSGTLAGVHTFSYEHST